MHDFLESFFGYEKCPKSMKVLDYGSSFTETLCVLWVHFTEKLGTFFINSLIKTGHSSTDFSQV